MDSLVALSGPHEGERHELAASQTIGRLRTNGIPLPQDTGSSRQHARLSRSGGVWALVDLRSSNGTFVNGERIERFELEDGDEISIGETTFRLDLEEAEVAPADSRPTPRPEGTEAPARGPDSRAGSPTRIEVRGGADPERVLRVAGKKESGSPMGLDVSQLGGTSKLVVVGGTFLVIAAVGVLAFLLAAA